MTERRPGKKPRRTAIVPRVVFQTVIAISVVPAVAAGVSGCGVGPSAAVDANFSVADGGPPPRDTGVARDAFFSVADATPPRDSGFGVADGGPPRDAAFGVADVGFSVAAPIDSGMIFGVAAPPDDAA